MIGCSNCRREIVVEMLIPSEVWEQICDGAYALCPVCMDERMVAKGLSAVGTAFFRGRALTTDITPEVFKAVLAWRPSQEFIERYGPAGNPALYKEPRNG